MVMRSTRARNRGSRKDFRNLEENVSVLKSYGFDCASNGYAVSEWNWDNDDPDDIEVAWLYKDGTLNATIGESYDDDTQQPDGEWEGNLVYVSSDGTYYDSEGYGDNAQEAIDMIEERLMEQLLDS